ncbi:hypothetical protein [Pseudoalteromonas sp. MMG024]|uniref:DUF7281 domain-containing protein n=1 Tax=Pseudoalteromonas sp. MMG024 TaxID=2909980 RepID=UPI001F3FE80F|nr:hypothetical protein [Pseudoalteromonas sp. MMG024]MCF6459174.1 hypothetical protein [Pseudoalteromonas sp. MMG024]
MLQALSKQSKITLAKFLDKGVGRLSFNKFGKVLSSYGLGTRREHYVYLTRAEKNDLAKLFELEIGEIEFFSEFNEESDRIELQGSSIDEKLSRIAVTLNDIRMLSFNGKYQINDQIFELPLNANLTMHYNEITSINHKVIVICENLTPFIQLGRYRNLLPTELIDALFIYRGNGSSVSGVYKLCNKLSNKVVAMTDLDPSGIVIANTIPNVSAVLYPQIDCLNHSTSLKHQKTLWNKQQRFIDSAEKYSARNETSLLFDYIKDKSIGVTQEAMFSAKLNLRLFFIK